MRATLAVGALLGAVVYGACGDGAGGGSADASDGGGFELPLGQLDADAGGGEPDAPPWTGPGLGIDYATTAAGVAPRYQPTADAWTAVPWPNDLRRLPDGKVDLSRFPANGVPLVEDYRDRGQEVLNGFGLNGSVYFQLDGPIDMDTLPEPQEAMKDPKATVQLVNATAGSPRFGQAMPLLFHFYGSGSDPYYLGNTLAMRPIYGFPLSEGETWCAVLTRGVKDASGNYLSRPKAFSDALAAEPTLEPLRQWLPTSGLLENDLAAATCFTTATPTRELRDLRAFLENEPVPPVTDSSYEGSTPFFHEIRGRYVAPNFQSGAKPYEQEGGDVLYDAAGDPIIAEQESMRFLLLVPKGHQMPAQGWPVVLYAHGTGVTAGFTSCKHVVADNILKEGFAMLCIDQPLHGDRTWKANVSETELYLVSFNFFNPSAGRMNFRQSAIDTMSLARAVAGGSFTFAADAFAYGKEIRLDGANIWFFGHSHGGLSGSIAFGVEPLLRGGVISGAGGVLVETILRRVDPIDIRGLIVPALQADDAHFNTFHPTLSLVQLLVDVTDPINYGPYWLRPATGGTAKHVFVTEGTLDQATPYVTTEALTAAAGVPIIEPVASDSIAHLLKGLFPIPEPVSLNADTDTGDKRTAGLRQWEGADHFVAFDSPQAIAMWKSFFHGVRLGAVPVIAQ